MTKSIVTLTYNGVTYRVLCNQVNVSGKKNNDSTPYTNIAGPVEAQTGAFENLLISLQGVHFTGESGTLTWAGLISMYKQPYGGASATGVQGPITLNVRYGSTVNLTGLEGSTNIKVVVDSFSFPIDTKDSRDGYLPIGTVTLKETK
jgi:hypothetical protein